jgi:short-subunit dehydrogenase
MMTGYIVKDKVLFVTGANKKNGIGRAIIEESISRGAKKIYATSRNIRQLDDLVAKFPEHIVPIELDITDYNQIKNAVVSAKDTNVIFNNSGFSSNSGCFYDYNEKNARMEMDVNYFGPMKLINEFSSYLLNNGNCAIVNIISIMALSQAPVYITYSASKSALYSATKSLRLELHDKKISVFSVFPGPTDTEMTAGYDGKKEIPERVTMRIFDGMENGILDITTDSFSDLFCDELKPNQKLLENVKAYFQ